MERLCLIMLLLPTVFSASNFKQYRLEDNRQARCPGKYKLNSPWYPDEEDCSCYYVCRISGEAVRMCCPSGLWWDHQTKTCMYFQDFNTQQQEKCLTLVRGIGTTKQLREIFIGRCWEYQLFRNPDAFQEGYRNCEDIFDSFARVFVNKAACRVIKPEDYRTVLEKSTIDLPVNKQIFWSGTYDISQAYANQGRRAVTLETTMIGYILNDVTWCGTTVVPGINFDSCPAFASCPNHVMASFWAEALETYARQAKGVVTVILNGSRTDGAAFRNNSFFAKHEFPNLQSDKVTRMRIWLAHDLDRPITETCTSRGSVWTLKRMAEAKGFSVECQDNPPPLRHLLCVNKPSSGHCKFVLANSPVIRYQHSAPEMEALQNEVQPRSSQNAAYDLYDNNDVFPVNGYAEGSENVNKYSKDLDNSEFKVLYPERNNDVGGEDETEV